MGNIQIRVLMYPCDNCGLRIYRRDFNEVEWKKIIKYHGDKKCEKY